ncbi:MAG: hypothetical protein E6K87_04590 [Thaumarchaeota archaeon]|nr:MAG: hypothetical protein E6K87_04590 [Nitrososphaerota archaeon]
MSTRISDGEFKAITEYANACGLCVSDLIKKVMIDKTCYLWLFPVEDKYFQQMYTVKPEDRLDTDEDLAEFVNKFRSYIGIRPLKVGEF